MGDSDDDYPQKHYPSSSSYPTSIRSRRPIQNPNFHTYRDDDDSDELEDDSNMYRNDEISRKNQNFMKQDEEEEDDDEDEEDDEDDDEEYRENGYGGRGYDGNDESKRRQKKRKLETLVSRYEFAPRVRDSSAEWSEDESFVLLEVWGERFLQLGRKSLRSEDWIEVAEKVSELCKVERSHVQCRNKLDVLKKKYKKERAKMEEMGGYFGQWVFFKKMDMLLSVSSRQQLSGLACGFDSGEYVFMNPKVYLSQSNAFDEMRDSPAESDSEGDDSDEMEPQGRGDGDGTSFRLLADSIQKFGAIYEKIEDSKRQQMMELERMRMDFQQDLELQKKQIVENAQAEIAKIREGNDDDTDSNTDTDVSAGNVSG
ncbi:trihelix transcription factor ASIL2 [Heracleum sosnowskyi]|uniref:Trihelix transcription factor ASIL2 n=1 Tax=Heracleum sosnowskyi TaxID=360622 RepID=A0AAD8I469_9APIA|nr:trihelix transcription factor ASIL2 [Heracleum sosnowskyi]